MASYLTLSRPRFWMYLIGPYGIGAAAALMHGGTMSWIGVFFALYFTFPANLLIYGVNDVYDFETDIVNEKKHGYETVLARTDRARLVRTLLLLHVPVLCAIPFLSLHAVAFLAFFFFFGIFYSAPPFRFKVRPFLDSFSNVLYVFPGYVAYTLFGGTSYAWHVFAAAAFWVMAMHAYSAVPDIAADTRAGIATIATSLGARATLVCCAALYIASSVLTAVVVHPIGWLGALVYGGLMLVSLRALKQGTLFSWYRRFPLVNAIMGALLFFSVIFQ